MNSRRIAAALAAAASAIALSSCSILVPGDEAVVTGSSAPASTPAQAADSDAPPASIGSYTRVAARPGTDITIWNPGTEFIDTDQLESELGLDFSSLTENALYNAAAAYTTLVPLAQETGDYTYLYALSTPSCELCGNIVNEILDFGATGHDRMGTRTTIDNTQQDVVLEDDTGIVVFGYSETYGIVVDENGEVLADCGASGPQWLIVTLEHDGAQWRVTSLQLVEPSTEEQQIEVN